MPHVWFKRKIRSGLLLLVLLVAVACGHSGSSPQYRSVVLKLAASSDSSVNLSGIGITLVLPSGVVTLILPDGATQDMASGSTPYLNGDGTVADGVVTVSGAAAPGMALTPVYTPATASTKGTLRIVVVSSQTTGFTPGEFATVTLKIPARDYRQQGSYSLTDFNPIDLFGNSVAGLTASFSEMP